MDYSYRLFGCLHNPVSALLGFLMMIVDFLNLSKTHQILVFSCGKNCSRLFTSSVSSPIILVVNKADYEMRRLRENKY